MANEILKNQVELFGSYGEDECEIQFTTNEVSTTVVNDLSATKVADKQCWVNGPLTYTVTILNNSGATVTHGRFIDFLDPDVVALDTTAGIKIDTVPLTTYTYNAGVLAFDLPDSTTGSTHVVTFKVNRV